MADYARLQALLEEDPEGFKKLIKEISDRTIIPHKFQREVVDSTARFKVMNCGRRWGKGQRESSSILTPQGWTTFGELREGDEVTNSDGGCSRVTGVFPKGEVPFYRVKFKDGSEVDCDFEHLWEVRRRWRRGRTNKYEVLGVEDLLREGLQIERADGKSEHRFSVRAVQPVQHPEVDLPIPPYTAGALLGDGCLTHSAGFCSADQEIVDAMRSEGTVLSLHKSTASMACKSYGVLGLYDTIKSLGMAVRAEHKHVPAIYMTASVYQRQSILQGLMDTGGWLESGRRLGFASASKQLTDDVRTLVLSLGGKVTPVIRKTTTHQDSYVLRFYMPESGNPFRLTRKADRFVGAPTERLARHITAIEAIEPAKSICISVDAPDHLYVTEDYVLTHNTVIAAHIFVSKSAEKNRMLWWVAPTYKVVKRGYAQVIEQLPPGVLAKPAPPDSHFDAGRQVVLQFKNGTKMEFYSAERPEGMLGAAVDFAVLDEAAIMPGRIWQQVVQPTLIDKKGGALMISTPRGRNWFYDAWTKGQDAQQPDWESWTYTTQDNPTLPKGEADRMAKDMPRMEADQEIYAKWLAAGSAVFSPTEHTVERLGVYSNGLVDGRKQITGPVFLGIDLARTNDYTVMYGTSELDRRNVYFERFNDVAWEEQRRRIRRAVRRLMQAGAEYVQLIVDEGNAGSVIVEDLEEAGFSVIGVNFTTHKANMVRLLANDLERGRAFILEEGLVEFENYTMTVSDAGRFKYSAPEGQHDDIVSAKMLSHWGCVNEGSGNMSVMDLEGETADLGSNPWDIDPDDDVDEDYADLVDMTEEQEADYAIGLEPEVYQVRRRFSGLSAEEIRRADRPAPRALTPEEQFASPHAVDFMRG